MAEQPSQEFFRCSHCQARLLDSSKACWRCERTFEEPEPGESLSKEFLPEPRRRFSFSLGTLLLLMTLVSVCLGLFTLHPGLGIFACIVSLPVFFRTYAVVRRRESRGEPVSSTEKATLFIGSFAVGSVLAVVVSIAAFCTFCGFCLAKFSAVNNAEWFFYCGGVCLVGVAALVSLVYLVKWIKRRYRRDIGIQEKQAQRPPQQDGQK